MTEVDQNKRIEKLERAYRVALYGDSPSAARFAEKRLEAAQKAAGNVPPGDSALPGGPGPGEDPAVEKPPSTEASQPDMVSEQLFDDIAALHNLKQPVTTYVDLTSRPPTVLAQQNEAGTLEEWSVSVGDFMTSNSISGIFVPITVVSPDGSDTYVVQVEPGPKEEDQIVRPDGRAYHLDQNRNYVNIPSPLADPFYQNLLKVAAANAIPVQPSET